MSSVSKAYEAQLNNIQSKTGKTLEELRSIVKKSGLEKHGQIRDLLQKDLGLGYGDANALVHFVLDSDGERAAKAKGSSTEDVLSEIYSGAKTALRPIHDKLINSINTFGEFEIAPKKGYVSLRRSKQFAMIGPTTKTRVDVGLNINHLETTSRLIQMPPKSMCQYKVNLSDVKEVDAELIGWIRQAFDAA
jgi:Domain of unknown function (DUF5655)/Domain of unknown function (DUF4287)